MRYLVLSVAVVLAWSTGLPARAQSAGTTGNRGLRSAAFPPVLTLDDAFQAALEHNFDVRIAAARVDEAQAHVRQAWSQLLPNLSAAGQYTFNYPEQKFTLGDADQLEQQALLFNSIADIIAAGAQANPDPAAQAEALARADELRQAADDIENTELTEAVIQPAHVFDGQIALHQPLFNGRALPMLQNAYAAVEVTRLGARQARAGILFGVARTYYQAVAAKQIEGIALKRTESERAHLERAQAREAEGLGTALVLQRAELDLARAEQQLRAARAGLTVAKAALGSLLGRSQDFDVVAPPPAAALEDAAPVEDLIARAVNVRDDLRLQKEALAIADRGRLDAWMRLLPSFGLTASVRATSNTGGFVDQPVSGAVGIQGSMPLFDGGLAWGAIEESDAKLRQEALRVQQAELLVEQEVRGTLDDIRLKKDAVATAARVAQLARTTKENADRLFEAGAATQLDVSDASLGAYAADVDLARTRLDLETARLGLAYALGELLPAK